MSDGQQRPDDHQQPGRRRQPGPDHEQSVSPPQAAGEAQQGHGLGQAEDQIGDGRRPQPGQVGLGDGEPGLPERSAARAPGPVRFADGTRSGLEWMDVVAAAVARIRAGELAKVVLALMLGRPAEDYLDTQRAAHLQRMRELTDQRRTGGVIQGLLADHGLFHLEADLHWIDLTTARLDALAQEVRR